MPSLFADHALLPEGWAKRVRLEWDATGVLTHVESDADPRGAPRASGPLLPGMPNVHSHAFQRAMAGLAEWRGHPTDDFWTWREAMYALVRRLSPEDVGAVAEHLYVELLKHGYTAVAEFHYLHNRADGTRYADETELAARICAAAEASGIALTLIPVLYAHGGFGNRPLDAAQQRFRGDPASIARLLRALASRRSKAPLRFGFAPHSARAVDGAMLREALAAVREIDAGMPIHMHLSEQTGEVEACRAAHGVTPFEWLEANVEVDSNWCFIHATHVTSAEMRAMAARGATVGLCPTTEANLGDGIFDFVAWRAAAGAWAIGGDSHVSVSPFEELQMLEYGQRLRHRQRNIAAGIDTPDVAGNLWRAAAAGGGRAIGQPTGQLARGRRADCVVLDTSRAQFEALSAAQSLAASTFGGVGGRIRNVYVAGECVVQDGRHAREEPAALAFRSALARLRS